MKRAAITTLQIVVTIALLWWVFHDEAKRARMFDALTHANIWWLLPGLLSIALVLALQTQRWFLLLRAIDIRISWFRCARLLLIGTFFNLFLFGATGGDVVKIYYAMRESANDKVGAFLSVALDRVIGVLALAFVSIVVLALSWGAFVRVPNARAMVFTVTLILGGLIGVIVLAAIVAVLQLEKQLPKWLPLRSVIVDMAAAIQRYLRASRALLSAFLISIPAHLLIFSSFYFVARSLSAKLNLLDLFSVMPIVNVITSLPISLQGVGVREKLFENLLHALYGTPAAQAVLISLGGYLLSAACSMVGGLVFLTYRPSDGHAASLREMSPAAEAVHPSA